MTNLLLPFECPICGSDGFSQVQVKGHDGVTRLTQAYECLGCSTMFRERERFTKRRLKVMGADGVDLKPALEKQRALKED
jgi:transcriptional regulator NrdR family protein